MKYLMDANALIQAADRYYRDPEFPGYWDWIRLLATNGTLGSVEAVRAELISPRVSALADSFPVGTFRAQDAAVASELAKISRWIDEHQMFTQRAKARFRRGADSHLIAAAKAYGSTIVTYERPEPDSKSSVKIPDVCREFDVQCIFPEDMLSREGARFVLDDAVRQELQTRISQSTSRRN